MVTTLVEFQPGIHQWALDFSIWNDGRAEMSKERAGDLARQCTELVHRGNDFPAVWSISAEKVMSWLTACRGNRSLLNIPLITGEQLVFDADVKKFRIQ
jgi:hypothetical protein